MKRWCREFCKCLALWGVSFPAVVASSADNFSMGIYFPQEAIHFDVKRDRATDTDAQKWDDYFSKSFDFADRNRDGVLDVNEAQNVPSPKLLLAMWRGDFDNLPADYARLYGIETRPSEPRPISKAAFFAYFRGQQLELPDLDLNDATDSLQAWESQWFFNQLAAPQASCTASSFRTSSQRLRRFDVNDDERWTVDEIRTAAKFDREKNKSSTDFPAPQIAVSRFAIPLDKAGRFQTSWFGLMDDFPENPKGLLALGKNALVGQATDKNLENALLDRVERRTGNRWILTERVAISSGLARFTLAQQSLSQQIETDDLNHDGKLDVAEINRSPSKDVLAIFLKIADRDGDSSLSFAELNDFLRLQSLIVERRITVSVTKVGPPLFDTLDVNGDGALSVRELTHGWSSVKAWAHNDTIAWSDVPYQLDVTCSYGPPRKATASRKLSTVSEDAPHWFQKMDANGDGDVSRREFLGTGVDFQKLDTDGDELISATEAKAAATK